MLPKSLLILAATLAVSAWARADMCVSRWSAQAAGPHPSAVKVADAGEGQLVQIDLAGLPKDAKLYRARLYVAQLDAELREPLKLTKGDAGFGGREVFLVTAPAQGDAEPKLQAKPLQAAGPAFDCLDATEAVGAWLSGQTANNGLYVKSGSVLDKDALSLEIAYEAKPDKLPAQVQGVSVLHRAGQSFITWKDTQDSFGDKPATWAQIREVLRGGEDAKEVRYRVYRHSKPIDAASIAQAALIAQVKPMSGFNINGWSLEKLINQVIFSNEDNGEMGVYGYFSGWSMWSGQGGKLVVNRFAIEDDKPLPAGAGLFVFSPAGAEKAYYAVTAMVDGVENCSDFPANVSKQVDEQPARWQPVRQPSSGKEFGFDFRGQRQFYVQWAAPPLAPRQGTYFNWSVHVPAVMLDKQFPKDKLLPVELYFHGPGYSYARPPVKFLENSIQIAPHDFPASGWYGYNDAAGTVKDYRQGVVAAHTQKRLAAFLNWAKGKFPIDATRIVGVGGDGAGLTALCQPEMFAYMLITGFESDVLNPKAAATFTQPWGPKSPDIKNEAGLSDWAWAELDYLLSGTQMPRALAKDQAVPGPADVKAPGWKQELPFFVIRGVTWGHDPGYVRGRGRFLYALQATGHGQYAHWAWGGALKPPAKYAGTWQGLDIANTTPFPAIAYSSADQEGEGEGNCNATYSWQPLKEDAGSLEMNISGREGSFDLTPRRLQQFKLAAGEKAAFEITPVASRERPLPASQAAPLTGEAVADANGILTLRGVTIPHGGAGVVVKLTKGK